MATSAISLYVSADGWHNVGMYNEKDQLESKYDLTFPELEALLNWIKQTAACKPPTPTLEELPLMHPETGELIS